MRAALDTNILVSAEELETTDRARAARNLVRDLPLGAGVVALQGLGELFNVLTRKARIPPAEARLRLEHWSELLDTVATDDAVLGAAVELAAWSGLHIWDAIHLSAAAAAGCELFLSEDLQHGFRWRGVTVVNPFAHPRHPLLLELRHPA